jgi:hypothetical protein
VAGRPAIRPHLAVRQDRACVVARAFPERSAAIFTRGIAHWTAKAR